MSYAIPSNEPAEFGTWDQAPRKEVRTRRLVSVGLPVFNGERFLAAAIDSLLGQTYPDIELIISDNASSDSTPQICELYASMDSRIRYFRQPTNIGAPRNWNFVARHARGEYLKWASANDFSHESAIAACLAALEASPQAVVCCGRTVLVDEDTGAHDPYERDIALLDDAPSARLAALFAQLKLNNAMNGLMRIDALKNTGLVRTYPAGDTVLMAELALAGKFVLLPERLLFRRVGARSSSATLADDQLNRFLDPQGALHQSHPRARMHVDLLLAVLRAPISLAERGRALRIALQVVYWDMRNTRRRRSRA